MTKNENKKLITKDVFSSQKLIYIFRVNDEDHKDLLKIGEATVYNNNITNIWEENTKELNEAALKRIGQETITVGTKFDLLYTTISIKEDGNAFMDKDVHRVLKASGIKNVPLKNDAGTATEWFKVDLETAKNAIKAVKECRYSLKNEEKSTKKTPIILREEQKRFVKETVEAFNKKHKKTYLWNAKMRFGKTITALSVIKEMQCKKTLIYTHRPVVNISWFEDYSKVFYEDGNTVNYGSHGEYGLPIDKLISDYDKVGTPFIYFASLQDLRGKDDKEDWKSRNKLVFDTEWDLVIIDEVHEGTQTELGKAVYNEVNKPNTKILSLSGTPFNVMGDFDEETISDWTYIMEQEAKENWDYSKGPNPYTCPKMNIFTFNMSDTITDLIDPSTKFFNFREFFKTYTGNLEMDGKILSKDKKIGDFIYEDKVLKFLDLLTAPNSNYPFSTMEYKRMFNHTLWMVPGVREAKALSNLLKNHKNFGNFDIVNVAGEGDEDVENTEALKMVRNAISKSDYTITLSCGRLTTGVTVPEWNAVLYLAGSKNTSMQNYLQTIFRVQSPYFKNGQVKENCYVFDFAPDRVLQVIPSLAQMSAKERYITSNNESNREQLKQLLNFLPVISYDGSSTIEYDVDSMMREIKKVTATKVVQEGFDCDDLYNVNLLKLSKLDIKEFEKLRKIVGTSNKETLKTITINAQGLTEAELKEINKTKKSNKVKRTKAQEESLKKYREAQKQKQTAISILRGISVRIPLLIYGLDGNFKEDIDLDKFSSQIDDESFAEFMPRGVTKELFDKFVKYFDRDVFNEAVRALRQRIIACDKLNPLERIYEISQIFSTFRNPDKETVLTPWRVINKQMEFTLGGYQLYEDNVVDWNNYVPKFIDNGEETKETLSNVNAKILDINSKTGLYSLYCAYSIYKKRLESLGSDEERINPELQKQLWYLTIQNNIYCVCKTQMAKIITLRTLCGFDIEVTKKKNLKYNIVYKGQYSANAQFYPDYVEACKSDPQKVADQLTDPDFWNKD